jgi:hypothetical protein
MEGSGRRQPPAFYAASIGFTDKWGLAESLRIRFEHRVPLHFGLIHKIKAGDSGGTFIGASMSRWKTIFIHLSIGAVGLGAGFWLGNWRSEKVHEQFFYFREWADVQSRIRVLDLLYKNDSDSAILKLESWLDRDAIIVGPNEYHPRPIKDEEKTILQMIAAHRNAHPFSQSTHPGINDMVQKALQSAQ